QPRFPPTPHQPAHTGGIRWNRWENKRGAGRRRIRTRLCRGASGRAAARGRFVHAPRLTWQPGGDFVLDRGRKAWRVSPWLAHCVPFRNYNPFVLRLLPTVHSIRATTDLSSVRRRTEGFARGA